MVYRSYLKGLPYNRYVRALIRPLFKPLYNPSLNCLARPIIKPLHLAFSDMMYIMPAVGKFRFELPSGKNFSMCSNGKDTIVNDIYWNGLNSFEQGTFRYFLKLILISRKFFDIGANTGLYSIIASIENPNAEIFSFEPNPDIFKFLKENVASNRINNIDIEQSALANYDGKSILYIPSNTDVLPTGSTLIDRNMPTNAIEVSTITLDTYCLVKNIFGVDLIKIDAESAEHLIIEGGLETIKRDHPNMICEVLNGNAEKLHEVLNSIGYEYWWLSKDGPIKKERLCGHDSDMNYLFVSKERKEALLELGIY
jgi:FkbM family methyltransferase